MSPTRPPSAILEAAWLRQQLARGETPTCEFKRQWYDLGNKDGKGEFVKDVTALANTATTEEPGRLVIGVEEAASGPVVVGVTSAEPRPETLTQILAEYTTPPVIAEHADVPWENSRVSVLTVNAQQARPHWTSRDVGRVRRDTLFVRRGTVVGIATMAETEAMFRQKDARLGSPPGLADDPLQVGFLTCPGMSDWRLVARVANTITEPVAGVTAMMDVRLPACPALFERRTTLVNATLYPGQAKEIGIDFAQIPVLSGGRRLSLNEVPHRWMDLLLTVRYRDRRGFFREMTAALTTGS